MRHVVTFITGLGRGGAEIVSLETVQATTGVFKHTVISLRSGGSLAPDFRAAGADVIELGLNTAFAPKRLVAAWRTLLTMRPDVIMGQMYFGCIAAALYRRFFARAIPVYWVIHHSLADMRRERMSTRVSILVCKWLSRTVCGIAFVSKQSAEDHRLAGFFAGRFFVISNGCDTEQFRYDPEGGRILRAKLGFSEDAFVFGHIARVHPLKDHETMFAALKLATEKIPRIAVIFCGAGTESLAVPPGLEHHVRLLGERNDVPQVMSACDAGVLSSSSEAAGNVVAEFLACERICVSTAVGTAADTIAGFGVIVPARSPNDLADALVSVANLPGGQLREMGAAARLSIEKKFPLKNTVAQFLALWSDDKRAGGLS